MFLWVCDSLTKPEVTLLCLIVRAEGANKMHPGENYQDFLKWVGGGGGGGRVVVFLGHLQFDPPPPYN